MFCTHCKGILPIVIQRLSAGLLDANPAYSGTHELKSMCDSNKPERLRLKVGKQRVLRRNSARIKVDRARLGLGMEHCAVHGQCR